MRKNWTSVEITYVTVLSTKQIFIFILARVGLLILNKAQEGGTMLSMLTYLWRFRSHVQVFNVIQLKLLLIYRRRSLGIVHCLFCNSIFFFYINFLVHWRFPRLKAFNIMKHNKPWRTTSYLALKTIPFVKNTEKWQCNYRHLLEIT